MRRRLTLAFFAVLAGVGLCLATQAVYPLLRPTSPIQPEWKQILSFRGGLDPSVGPVWAKVFVAYREVTDDYGTDPIEKNRIEIVGPGASRLEWTGPNEFAGFRCDVLDLDGDGSKEFVFGPQFVRVVAYRDGQFFLRNCFVGACDDLLSPGEVEMLDLDGDGRYEFADTTLLGDGPPVDPARQHEASVWKWSKDRGFYQVPELVPVYRSKIR